MLPQLEQKVSFGNSLPIDGGWGASLVAQMVKNLPAMQETGVLSLGQEDPLEEGMAPTPVFLPEESYGQRSLAGYSLWGHKESGTTEWLTLLLFIFNSGYR